MTRTDDGRIDWVFPHFDDESMGDTIELLKTFDVFFLGRSNYESQAQTWPTAQGPIADIMNSTPKIVFSTTLQSADWQNSTIAAGTPEQEIARLRTHGVENVGVAGGARLAQYMASRGLVDEYHLSIHPVALGSGLPIFTTKVPLRLVESKRYATGMIANRYDAEPVE